MGTCYSKSGHELDASYTDNRPKERKGSKNGHVKSKKGPKLVVNDTDYIQKDLSDTVYTEDSHVIQNTLDVDNKSQQTSLDQLTKDGSKSIDNQTGLQINTQNELLVLTGSDKTGLHNEDNNVTNLNTNLQNVIAEPMKQINAIDVGSCESAQDGMVVTSDSGIGIEQCDSANANVTCKYSKCCDPNIKTEKYVTDAPPYSSSHGGENVHSCACASNPKLYDSGDNVFHSEHSNATNCNHGECQGHFFSRGSDLNTSSESILKSNLKKNLTSNARRKKILSLKSADSLDWIDSMSYLDRTKSVCSSIMAHDISQLIAPLATFDSVDFALGNSYDFSKGIREKKAQSTVEYCSDTFQFQFDFSGLEGEKRQSLASLDQLSESVRSMDSAPDLDKIKLALQHSSVSTPTEHRSFTESGETSYELGSIQQPEVTTMVMNGREVVVIDSELFSQIIDEIQLLKMKLSQLTDVIQDAEDSDIPHILSSSA